MTISANEARALLDAATAGPWHTMMGWGGVRLGIEADGFSVVVYGTDDDDAGVECDEDARLIAAAPDLAATVIELSERIDKVLALHAEVGRRWDSIHEHYTSDCWTCGQPYPCDTVLALMQGGEQS